MRKYYYDQDDENDELPDEVVFGLEDDGYGPDDRIELDDPEKISMEDEYIPKSLVSLLRTELKRMYCDRGSLTFRYNGEDYEGIPMLEINPNKFVFELEDKKLKSFLISDITII